MRFEEMRRQAIRIVVERSRADALLILQPSVPTTDPSEEIAWWEGVRQLAEAKQWEAVERARDAGHSWADIGAALETTSGGARQRYRSRTLRRERALRAFNATSMQLGRPTDI